MSDERMRHKLHAFIALAVSGYYFALAIPLIIRSLRNSSPLLDEIVARKIAYCAWQDTSLDAVHYSLNPLLVVFVCLFPIVLAFGISLKIGHPRWYVAVFVVAAYVAGTRLFAPQFLAHFHFRVPSTSYFFRNIGVSFVLSGVTVGTVFLHRKTKANDNPHGTLLACSFLWMMVAFHFLASFFYIFAASVAIE